MTTHTPTTAYSYIRFSSDRQKQGDSLRRQTEESRRYAREQGWELDETMRDLGVSAWKGKNRQTGALAAFLKLVEAGKIAKGSWLIVEAMDRLSREQISDALSTFLAIIRAGVGIVTLQDRKTYSLKSVNDAPYELMYSITLMVGAHEYSSKLSFRVRAARERALTRLAEGDRHRVHGKAPFWCDLKEGGYKPNPERVKIVRQMIAWTMAGTGTLGIARRLTDSQTLTAHGKTTWSTGTIRTILRGRALMGEYRPTRMVNGRRVPGEPVKDYYPAVLSEKEWLKLQSAMDSRKKTIRGRTGELVNIFSRLLKSGDDGSVMRVVSCRNGVQAKTYKYLNSCMTMTGGAHTPGFPYAPVESAFLHFIREVTLDKPQAEASNLPALQAEEKQHAARLASLQTALIDGDTAAISAIVTAARTVEGKLLATRKAIEQERAKAVATQVTTADFEPLADRLFKAEKKGEFRQKIKLAIADVVKAATIWVSVQGIRRAAVVKVEFHGQQVRYFGVVTERGKPPVLALASRSPSATSGPMEMLTNLLKQQYAIGDFIALLEEEAPGKWTAAIPSHSEEMKKLGPPQFTPQFHGKAWKIVSSHKT